VLLAQVKLKEGYIAHLEKKSGAALPEREASLRAEIDALQKQLLCHPQVPPVASIGSMIYIYIYIYIYIIVYWNGCRVDLTTWLCESIRE
jgi:hypothetical protein